MARKGSWHILGAHLSQVLRQLWEKEHRKRNDKEEKGLPFWERSSLTHSVHVTYNSVPAGIAEKSNYSMFSFFGVFRSTGDSGVEGILGGILGSREQTSRFLTHNKYVLKIQNKKFGYLYQSFFLHRGMYSVETEKNKAEGYPSFAEV